MTYKKGIIICIVIIASWLLIVFNVIILILDCALYVMDDRACVQSFHDKSIDFLPHCDRSNNHQVYVH